MNTSLYEDYGTIRINLRKLMDEKNISISEMSKITGLKYDIVKKYYLGNCYQLDTGTLAKFCYVLNCEIADLIMYIGDKKD